MTLSVRSLAPLVAVLLGNGTHHLCAETRDLGRGFADHGVATPVSTHRGTVATADGSGRDMALVWLFDHRGTYALLAIDAATGASQTFPTPFPWSGDAPFSSILTSTHRYDTHFGSHFCEFDPAMRAFTFQKPTTPQMAMSMTEADDGKVWSATYPDCGLVAYDPRSRTLRDYGSVHAENWAQYPRALATDEAGWVYVGIGNTASQILIVDPRTGKAQPVVPESERGIGGVHLERDRNGKVYGRAAGSGQDNWYEFHRGTFRRVGKTGPQHEKPIITGSQGLFHQVFPDGKRLVRCDTVERVLESSDPRTGKTVKVSFTYPSEGAYVMGLAAAPDGTICGGTTFPMRFFAYDPRSDHWTNHPAFSQFNTVARQGAHFFVGGYPRGFLLDWDPARGWVDTDPARDQSNPRFLTDCEPTIDRPHALLAHPDGKTMILAGTPGYGYTGGGLLFWNRETRTRTLLEHTDLLPQHSTMSLAALPGGKLVGGTTTSPGTGGEKKAREAELYILDLATRKLEWHAALFPGVQEYTALHAGPGGQVFGFVDRRKFFVFDPGARRVVHEEDTLSRFGPCVAPQGPRVILTGGGAVYILFARKLARLEPATYEITPIAESPVPIDAGGDVLDGRIYFSSGSHLYSYRIR